MKNTIKRAFSMLMCLVMLLSLVSGIIPGVAVEAQAAEGDKFIIADGTTSNVSYDAAAGTINTDGTSNAYIYFGAGNETGYARNWEVSGTISGSQPFLSFGVKDSTGKTQWFCILENTMALQRHWNWWDTKQAIDDVYVTYNQAATSYYWGENSTMDFKVVVAADVMKVYFGNSSNAMSLAWNLPLTKSTYGGFSAGSQYQVGITTCDPKAQAFTNVTASANNDAAFALASDSTAALTSDPAAASIDGSGVGNGFIYFAADTDNGYAHNWEATGTINKNAQPFLSFGVRDTNGKTQWFCILEDHISLQRHWDWWSNQYANDGTYTIYNQAATSFYWNEEAGAKLNYKVVVSDDTMKVYFGNDANDMALAWNLPLTNSTFGGFVPGSKYQVGITWADAVTTLTFNGVNVAASNNDADETFYISSASGTVADQANATLTTDGVGNTETYFAADAENSYAKNWRLSGTITKADISSNLFLSFGLRDTSGKEQWFCILEDHVSLQRYWDWWANQYANDGEHAIYNQATTSFYWKESAQGGQKLNFVLIVEDDVLKAYFGNDNHAMSLAWSFPLTEIGFGGFEAGTAYQLAMNTVEPCLLTVSDISSITSELVDAPKEKTTLADLYIRDPFILVENDTYYLYGTREFGKFDVYTSTDMEIWEKQDPCFVGDSDFWGNASASVEGAEAAYWAPEVHKYNDAYYMIATFTQEGTTNQQASVILKSDSPVGPFEVWSDGAITPAGHSCLDATLYVENGTPYLVYAHEWQCACRNYDGTGSMDYIQLSADLKTTIGSSAELFGADDLTSWWEELLGSGASTTTDGPFVYTDANGQNYLLWATHIDGTYTQIATKFTTLAGGMNPQQDSIKLYTNDGGHGMIFTDLNGVETMVLHTPNSGDTRATLFDVNLSSNGISLVQRATPVSADRYDVSNYSAKAATQAEKWADAIEGNTTVFIGDSFFDQEDFFTTFSSLYEGKDVLCLGIGGTTTYQWQTFIDNWFNGVCPKNIVVNVGTNNLSFSDAAQVIAGLQKLFIDLQAEFPNANFYWFSIAPRNDMDCTDKKTAINSAMRTWCAENNVTYIASPITDPATDCTDGLHPTAETYAEYAAALEAAGCVINDPVADRFTIASNSSNVTSKPKQGIVSISSSAGNSETIFAANAEGGYATNWEMTGTITKANASAGTFLSFGVKDANGKDQWFCILEDCMARQRYWSWWDTKYSPDDIHVAYSQASTSFYWKEAAGAVLNYKIVIENDVMKVYFGNESNELTLAWCLPLTNATFGGFEPGTAYQVGINTQDAIDLTISDITVTTSNEAADKFITSSVSSGVVADTAAGTLTVPGGGSEIFFASKETVNGYAKNWETTGTITKDDMSASLFLSFGVKDTTGKDKWFCILENTVALQRYWNWWDTKQPIDGTYVQYNQASTSFYWKEAAGNNLDYTIVIHNDVLKVYFGNDNNAMALAWSFPLTEETYGGFAAGSQYQIGINAVDPAAFTVSNIEVHHVGCVYSESVVAPTCTEQGYTLHTCSICGASYKDTYVDSLGGHNYVDGICSACGDTKDLIAGWNLSLGDDIGAHFHLTLTEEEAAKTQVNFTVAGATVSVPASEAEIKDGKYVFSVNVAAAQMTDTISVEVVIGENVVQTGEYTVRQYAEYILTDANDEFTAETEAMVKAMLNYGAMAQIYFDYNAEAENLANVGYEETNFTAVPTEAETIVEGKISGVSYYGSSLLFRSKTAVRYYFTGDITGCTFTVNGDALTPVEKDGMWYVEISDINPQDLDQAINVVVTDAEGNTISVTYGPMNYIVRKSVSGSDALKNLLLAMYNYHLTAKACA